jgi:hypothetical protein
VKGDEISEGDEIYDMRGDEQDRAYKRGQVTALDRTISNTLEQSGTEGCNECIVLPTTE